MVVLEDKISKHNINSKTNDFIQKREERVYLFSSCTRASALLICPIFCQKSATAKHPFLPLLGSGLQLTPSLLIRGI
jgi:hypothetical protein